MTQKIDNTCIVMFSNRATQDMLFNALVSVLDKTSVEPENVRIYTFYEVDPSLKQDFPGVNFIHETRFDDVDQSFQPWNPAADTGFKRVASKRWWMLDKALDDYTRVIYLDVDVVVLRDIVDYFENSAPKNVDIFGQDDLINICTGVLFLRSNDRTRAIIEECKKHNHRDQIVFNDVIMKLPCEVRMLSRKHFPCGRTFWEDQKHIIQSQYLVHMNWVVGKEKKIERLSEVGLWNPPEKSLVQEEI